MKFFGWYVIGLISVLLISSIVISIREVREDFAVDGSEGGSTKKDTEILDSAFTNAKSQLSNNSFVEYHVSEDILRKSTQHKLKGMNIIDENGVQMVMDFEPTQVFPVYYTPGSYLYGASAFVPSYQDSVKLSEIKSLLKKDIDPLQWSWSTETNKQPELYNNNTGKPIDLKPIIKEDIPITGILPTGYFVLPKTKTANNFQIGMIPEGYYIYDDSNMAKIPPGFLASVDKMYIYRNSDATLSSKKYQATDLSSY